MVATRDTGYVDGPGVVFYKLIAVDVHGNASHVAIASPEAPVAALAALVGIESVPEHIRLTWYSGDNPGLQATVYRRTEQTAWESMGSIVADGTGYMRYDDSGVASGARYGYRLGILDGDEEVFTSEAWASAEAWALRLEGVRPNPAPAGRMTVQLVLRDGSPAQLEAFDVGGRRVAVREVGGLGAGRHTVDLTEGRRVPAGLYLIRLHQGAMVQTARAVVLD